MIIALASFVLGLILGCRYGVVSLLIPSLVLIVFVPCEGYLYSHSWGYMLVVVIAYLFCLQGGYFIAAGAAIHFGSRKRLETLQNSNSRVEE